MIGEKLNNPLTPEIIGDPECPILHRWTLFPPLLENLGHKAPNWMPKLLLHHFMPNADERHFHDHPWPFIILILKGGYDDLVPCLACDGTGEHRYGGFDRVHAESSTMVRTFTKVEPCADCNGRGFVVGDRMEFGTVRYRPSTHIHRTMVYPTGCWSLVLTGPLNRMWGFWVNGKWMLYKEYRKRYGHGMRCT